VSLIVVALAAGGALAIGHAPVEKDINNVSVASLDSTCPKIEWPYGCEWRKASTSATKHLSQPKNRHGHLYRLNLSLFR
jgi:hypothetical protein